MTTLADQLLPDPLWQRVQRRCYPTLPFAWAGPRRSLVMRYMS